MIHNSQKTFKPKICKYGKEIFIPTRNMQPTCKEHQYDYALLLVKKNREKKRIEEQKAERIKTKAIKVKITNWKIELQPKINHIARLIDYGLPCLARANSSNQIHGGHVFSSGGHRNITYNLHNIHRQGAQSNHFQNDDGLLREGVVREYGEGYMSFISGLRKTPVPKYSNNEYYGFYLIALNIIKRLKKEQRIRSVTERIELRNQINKELNIYPAEFQTYNI